MLDRKALVRRNEVERQPVVDVHRRKRSGTGLCPRHAEQLRQPLRRRDLIAARHDEVIELDGHGASPHYLRVRRYLFFFFASAATRFSRARARTIRPINAYGIGSASGNLRLPFSFAYFEMSFRSFA